MQSCVVAAEHSDPAIGRYLMQNVFIIGVCELRSDVFRGIRPPGNEAFFKAVKLHEFSGILNNLFHGSEPMRRLPEIWNRLKQTPRVGMKGIVKQLADACILQVAARVFSARSAGNSTFFLQSSAPIISNF